MKTLSILAVSLLALGTTTTFAQRGAEQVIKKVAPAVVPTPDIQFQGTAHRTGRAEQWLEVEVNFESAPEWTDELTFKYYILLAGKCLTGEVTHVNIPKGRDLNSVMYIAPRTLQRLLDNKALTPNVIENVGVQILNKGAVVATESFKRMPNPQWWQSMPQVSGMVINKLDTPFAPLYWDRYEAIKPPAK
jgi:hypothetical protein